MGVALQQGACQAGALLAVCACSEGEFPAGMPALGAGVSTLNEDGSNPGCVLDATRNAALRIHRLFTEPLKLYIRPGEILGKTRRGLFKFALRTS